MLARYLDIDKTCTSLNLLSHDCKKKTTSISLKAQKFTKNTDDKSDFFLFNKTQKTRDNNMHSKIGHFVKMLLYLQIDIYWKFYYYYLLPRIN